MTEAFGARPGKVHGGDGRVSAPEPVAARERGLVPRTCLRVGAGVANPQICDYLDADGVKIRRSPAREPCLARTDRPFADASGGTRREAQRFYVRFSYPGGSRTKPRRVLAKVGSRPGELCLRVGFIVANMPPAAESVAFHDKRATCERWVEAGEATIQGTQPSCRSFAADGLRPELHALA